MQAVEFFSGIGAFACAARSSNIEIVAAFDQGQDANCVYELNHGLKPNSRNLDSIAAKDIPPAEIWWMSPPCTPFTVRGKRGDIHDTRAAAFLNLISLIPKCQPKLLVVENVIGFVTSQVRKRLMDVLIENNYVIRERSLCSTDFGIPMKRPRHFVVAFKEEFESEIPSLTPACEQLLHHFLDTEVVPDLYLPVDLAKYFQALNIVEPYCLESEGQSYAICFTSNYSKSARASGSFLKMPDGRIRRFSPDEILRLLGFPVAFAFPEYMHLASRWRLLGNSVDVRCIQFLLAGLKANCQPGL